MMNYIFICIVFLSLLTFYWSIGRDKSVILIIIFWQLIVASLVYTRVFEQNPQYFLSIIGITILLFTLLVRRLLTYSVRPIHLLSIHLLRIPIEIILYHLYLEGQIPEIMTFKGWNFDIIIGLSTVVILVYIKIGKKSLDNKFFLWWNIVGCLFLLIIVIIAILSSPIPIQIFGLDQPNRALLTLPYCMLPTCIVPLVFISHILIFNIFKKNVILNQ